MREEASAGGVVVQRVDILSAPARALIEALNAELSGRYPEEGATHFRLDPAEVADGQGAFLIASSSGKPVGCGAVRRIEARTGEIKRMYVSPDAGAASGGRFSRRSRPRRGPSGSRAWSSRLGFARVRRSPSTRVPASRGSLPSAST